MPQFRFDPIKNSWVIIAAGRGQRPSHYGGEGSSLVEPKRCPFCEGNEAMTPPEVFAVREDGSAPDTPGWTVRIVPNKFPALSPDLNPEPMVEGIDSSAPAFGTHEILIETPTRNRQMVDMEPGELRGVLSVFRDRMASHLSDGRFKAVIGFKNHGKEAGASLVHSHCQVMAMSMIPHSVAAMAESFTDHYEKNGECMLCEIIKREEGEGRRVVEKSESFFALAPFAAASPFQVRIVPISHSSDFTQISDDEVAALADILGSTLRRLRGALGEHPWNMVIYSTPLVAEGGEGSESFHWFLEITPRVTVKAGFEMGSGVSINIVAPEECAKLLRSSV